MNNKIIDIKKILPYEKIIYTLAKKDYDKCGIYAILINNNIIYIGKTNQSFCQRFAYHKSGFKHGVAAIYVGVREALIAKQKVEMKVLISFNKDEFNIRETECMEYALITTLKPKYNILGVSKGYRFSK